MKFALCITLLAFCLSSQAQTTAPVSPKSGVKLIEPSKSEPVPAPGAKAAAPAKVNPETAKPEPLTPPVPKQPKSPKATKQKEPTVIDSDETRFDPKTGHHIFVGNVKVKSPQFTLVTDGQLDVKMKQAKKTPPTAPADPKAIKTDTTKAKGDSDGEDATSDIETAIANGKLSTVTQVGPDGKIKEGTGRIIIFDDVKKTLTLKEWPTVRSGPNLIIATDASTIMILDDKNNLTVKGPNTTRLEPDKDPDKKPKASSTR